MQVSKWVTLGAGMIFILIVAAYLNAQHLYYMAAILLTLPAVSYTLGWYALRGLTFTRELPPAGWAGEEGMITYVARNASRIPRFFLSIQEPLPSWLEFTDIEPPLFNIEGAPSQALEDAASTRVSRPIRYHRRGAHTLRNFEVTAIDPLGVFAFTQRMHGEGEIVAYPVPLPMRTFSLTGADRYGWQEFTAAALRGGSVDPDGVREYVPGDPLRRIHWRQTARTGKLAVIEFEEPQTVDLVLVLDLHNRSRSGSAANAVLERAVTFAASLAHQAIQSGASVRLIVPPDIAENERDAASFAAAANPGRGQEHLLLVLDALARAEARSSQQASALIADAVGPVPPGTTLLVVTSESDRQLADALSHYTAAQIRVGVVFVDGRTTDQASMPSSSGHERYFSELLSVQVQPFLLSSENAADPTPERISYATIRS